MNQPLVNKGFKPLSQLAVFFGVWGLGFILASITSLIILSVAGLPLEGMEQAMTNPAFAGTIRLLQAVTTLFVFGLPAILFAFICYRNGWLAIGIANHWVWKTAGLCVVMILASGPLIEGLGALNKAIPISSSLRATFDRMEQNYAEQVKAMLTLKSPGEYIRSLMMVAVLPAVLEELLFRGAMQNILTRWWRSPWTAIIVTSIIFSAIHGSWYGFIPRMVLGVLLGAVFYYTANLWYSILMHFLNNALAVTMMYYYTIQGKPININEPMSLPWWTGIFSLIAVVFLLLWLRKHYSIKMPPEVFNNRNNPFDNRNTFAELQK